MAATRYIPAGRTSLVKRGQVALQLQTEYASRPLPRITTTISRNGRVLHKIEREMIKAIETIEEQQHTETVIRRQHEEISDIIRSPQFNIQLEPQEKTRPKSKTKSKQPGSDEPQELAHAEYPDAEMSARPERVDQTAYAYERLLNAPGVEYVFRLDNDGNFVGHKDGKAFKKKFGALTKNLPELMNLFSMLPGTGGQREAGVCEIEMDRLYFASVGTECYFIMVERVDGDTDFETMIKRAIYGDEEVDREMRSR